VPLVATFVFTHGQENERVTLTSVHNKSKRSGGSVSEDARQAQSAAINAWAKANAPKNDHEHLGAFGDRNAYDGELPLQIETKDGALRELDGQLPADDRYSTQYGGTSASLDHDTVKTSVSVTLDIVHMNSDFDARHRASDHDGTVTAWDFRRAAKA
jgi:predicted extracellular nuclease